jgi:hypothetical protein
VFRRTIFSEKTMGSGNMSSTLDIVLHLLSQQ